MSEDNSLEFDSELALLNRASKQAGQALIDISVKNDKNLKKWSDETKRPNDLTVTECAGFISKTENDAGLDMGLDIQAAGGVAVLRLWGIKSELTGNGNEIFNNLQLNFKLDYDQAQTLAAKADKINRDDLRTALSNEDTYLQQLILNDHSGIDKISGQAYGERYDLITASGVNEFTSWQGIAYDSSSAKALSATEISDKMTAILQVLGS